VPTAKNYMTDKQWGKSFHEGRVGRRPVRN
jgi:hypothetical protein